MSIEARRGLPSHCTLQDEVRTMLCTRLTQCLRFLTNISRRWGASKACADRCMPLLYKISNVVHATAIADINEENAITRDIAGLLSSDGPLTWDQSNLADFPLGSINPVGEHGDVLFDASELIQWDMDWGPTMEGSSLL